MALSDHVDGFGRSSAVFVPIECVPNEIRKKNYRALSLRIIEVNYSGPLYRQDFKICVFYCQLLF